MCANCFPPAVCFAIICLLFFNVVSRRRRRGAPIIPAYNPRSWSTGYNQQNQNQNQGPYLSYPLGYQQPGSRGDDYQPPAGPPPPRGSTPPPPYPGQVKGYDGEANSGYGYPNIPAQVPSAPPNGSAVPETPHTPPAAHVHPDVRSSRTHLGCLS